MKDESRKTHLLYLISIQFSSLFTFVSSFYSSTSLCIPPSIPARRLHLYTSLFVSISLLKPPESLYLLLSTSVYLFLPLSLSPTFSLSLSPLSVSLPPSVSLCLPPTVLHHGSSVPVLLVLLPAGSAGSPRRPELVPPQRRRQQCGLRPREGRRLPR